MSLETLKTKRTELIEKLDELQTESAEKLFEIELDDRKQIKTIMEHLNKGFTWKTQNAAVVVALYDQLKKQNKELTSSEEEATVIKLKAHELNGLYQALLNVEGTGVESARRFITMLTNVGETVTNAMSVLGDMNKEISEMHAELDATEREIAELENVEEVEPELEKTTLENRV
jgi:hypothetical protein